MLFLPTLLLPLLSSTPVLAVGYGCCNTNLQGTVTSMGALSTIQCWGQGQLYGGLVYCCLDDKIINVKVLLLMWIYVSVLIVSQLAVMLRGGGDIMLHVRVDVLVGRIRVVLALVRCGRRDERRQGGWEIVGLVCLKVFLGDGEGRDLSWKWISEILRRDIPQDRQIFKA